MSGFAFILVIMSALLHGLWNFATKRASGNLGVLYIGVSGACVVLLPLVIVRTSGLMVAPAFHFVITTGIIHAFYFFFLSQAYRHGQISTVYPVARGFGVIGTALVATAALGERLSFTGLLGIVSAGIGIFMIGAAIGQGSAGRKGMWFALLVGCTMIGYSIVDKLAMSWIDPVVYIFWLFLISMALLTPYVFIKKRGDLHAAWRNHRRHSVAIGIGSTAGYLLILYVYQMAQVSYVVPVREFSVVIGSILGVLFLREPLSVRKIVSIAMVVAGLVLIRIA